MIRPDRWILIEWTKNGNSFKKLLVGWQATGAWELSHVIDTIEDRDDYWEVYVRNGTMYKLLKNLQGTTPNTLKIYNEMSQKATSDPEVTIGVLSV